jgi:hypothetical protein
VGGKLAVKAVFNVLTNKEARRSIQRASPILEGFDISRGGMDETAFIDAEVYGKLGSCAEDGFSTR